MITKQTKKFSQNSKVDYLAPSVAVIKFSTHHVICTSRDVFEVESMDREETLDW